MHGILMVYLLLFFLLLKRVVIVSPGPPRFFLFLFLSIIYIYIYIYICMCVRAYFYPHLCYLVNLVLPPTGFWLFLFGISYFFMFRCWSSSVAKIQLFLKRYVFYVFYFLGLLTIFFGLERKKIEREWVRSLIDWELQQGFLYWLTLIHCLLA